MAAQNEVLISARAFMQVAASAHGLMGSRGERCDDFLANAIQQASWLKSLSLIAPSGRVICSSNADVVGMDISHLPHFRLAMESGKFALGDYFVGSVLGPTLIAALPHYAADGSIDIVVSAALELYGHIEGDRCLKKISEVLMAGTRTCSAGATLAMPPSFRKYVARAYDFTARYGGEEFAVLLQRADLETARRVAGRLRLAVENLSIAHEASPLGFVTISVGAISMVPAEGDSAQNLVERADAALYEAKRRGRNVVIAHCESMLAKAS